MTALAYQRFETPLGQRQSNRTLKINTSRERYVDNNIYHRALKSTGEVKIKLSRKGLCSKRSQEGTGNF